MIPSALAIGLALASPGGGSVEVDADALRAIQEELRALRAEGEAQRAEIEALRRSLDDGADREGAVPAPERVAFGDAARVEPGEVVRDAVAFGQDVVVEGEVSGDATAFGGDVIVRDAGLVRGDAVAFGGEVVVEPGGRVLGDRVALEGPGGSSHGRPAREGPGLLATLYHRAVLMLSFAGAGVLVVGLFPNRVDRVARGLEEAPVWSGLVGAAVTTLITVFSVLFLLVTIGLGFPVSALAMGVLGAAWMFGFVGLCQAVGDRLPFDHKPHGRWLAFLVGTALLACLGSLPWVGWLLVAAGSMVGIGAAITSRFGGR